jgi:hypothetical protein
VTLAVTALLFFGGSAAYADSCSYPATYPGDTAPKAAIAGWMAGAAQAAGLPGELPVMGALVDSGLQNLPQGDSSDAGYFQIRVDIWNTGAYAGFPDHPTLQLQWFIDQAQAVRQKQLAMGNASYGQAPATWGSWVADVERPLTQYRYRYQLRLADAQALVAAGCTPVPDSAPQPGAPGDQGTSGTPAPDAQLIPDSVLPSLSLGLRKVQNPLRSGALVVSARCTNEDCFTHAAAAVAVPKRGVFRMSADPQQLAQNQSGTFRLPISNRLAKALAASLRRHQCPLGVIRVVAANSGGWRVSASRTVRFARGCG